MNGTQGLPPRILVGRRLLLRMAGAADVPAIVDYFRRNRRHLRSWEPRRPKSFFTEAHWAEQVRKNKAEFRKDRSLRLFVFGSEDPQRVLGVVNFTNFVRGAFRACTLGYSLDAEKQGHGYMTEALRLAIPFVFRRMGFHRIMANYIPRNVRSGEVLKRLGFTIEGRARAYLKIDGRWQDHVLTSLVKGLQPTPSARHWNR